MVGQITPVVLLAAAFLSKFFDTFSFFMAMWTCATSVLVAILETSTVFSFLPCVPDITRLRERLLETLRLKYHLARAALYVLLSYFIWRENTFCIMGAFVLDVSAVLYVFAYINKRSDGNVHDGIQDWDTGEEQDLDQDSEAGSTLLQASRFGTF